MTTAPAKPRSHEIDRLKDFFFGGGEALPVQSYSWFIRHARSDSASALIALLAAAACFMCHQSTPIDRRIFRTGHMTPNSLSHSFRKHTAGQGNRHVHQPPEEAALILRYLRFELGEARMPVRVQSGFQSRPNLCMTDMMVTAILRSPTQEPAPRVTDLIPLHCLSTTGTGVFSIDVPHPTRHKDREP